LLSLTPEKGNAAAKRACLSQDAAIRSIKNAHSIPLTARKQLFIIHYQETCSAFQLLERLIHAASALALIGQVFPIRPKVGVYSHHERGCARKPIKDSLESSETLQRFVCAFLAWLENMAIRAS
jgi:hypothetical protein